MKVRRQDILDAAMGVLREQGLAGFTQPRIAAKAGVRQSHLTYYFPTRLDLLTAVARAAVDGKLKAFDALLELTSPKKVAEAIASAVVRHQDTRVLMALAQSADLELPIREVFREFAAGILQRFGTLFENLGIRSTDQDYHLLHALSVGLAVVDLATGRNDGERIAARVIEAVLTPPSNLAGAKGQATRSKPKRCKPKQTKLK